MEFQSMAGIVTDRKNYSEEDWGSLHEEKLHLNLPLNDWDRVLVAREQMKQHKLRFKGK